MWTSEGGWVLTYFLLTDMKFNVLLFLCITDIPCLPTPHPQQLFKIIKTILSSRTVQKGIEAGFGSQVIVGSPRTYSKQVCLKHHLCFGKRYQYVRDILVRLVSLLPTWESSFRVKTSCWAAGGCRHWKCEGLCIWAQSGVPLWSRQQSGKEMISNGYFWHYVSLCSTAKWADPETRGSNFQDFPPTGISKNTCTRTFLATLFVIEKPRQTQLEHPHSSTA